jgi:hypothetical protein
METLDLIPDLTDLELAILLCLTAQEHCLIETRQDYVEDVAKELALVLTIPFPKLGVLPAYRQPNI